MSRVCSIFSQLLQLFSRVEFESAVRQHKAERHARGFTGWGQSWPCFSANWVGPIAYGRFAKG